MADLDLILGRLTRLARAGRPLALLFDYDGTLAPIRPTPAEAVLPACVRRALARLAARSTVGVGVVSGRALADLQGMVGLDEVYYAGTSGLEVDLLDRRLTPPGIELARAPLDQLAGRLSDVAAAYPGAWVEQKPFGLTLHYRAVPRPRAGRLRLDAAEALFPWAGQVRVEDVTLGLEVVPDVGWDKGTAVRQILADFGGTAYPVYAGDAANDAPALAAVEASGGLSIGVGPNAPKAMTQLCGSGVVGSLAILLAAVLADEPLAVAR
jgi:trehalose 6-phosphate phosphatase